MKILIVGNWKMNKKAEEATSLSRALRRELEGIVEREVVICPPFTVLGTVKKEISGSNILLGGQNMHWENAGAYTGEISPLMLKDVGCDYVIIGHSERRTYFGESDAMINQKVKASFNSDLIPIVCVGETLVQREKGDAFKIVEKQIKEGVGDLNIEEVNKLVIAYEPVWAIGTGITATPLEASQMHKFIRKILEVIFPGKAGIIRILYGGSIKPENISQLMACEDIDGGLVGGASICLDSFIKIVKFR